MGTVSLLIEQILVLAIIAAIGWIVARSDLLSGDYTRTINLLVLYVASPAAIIYSFISQPLSMDLLLGIGLSFLAALLNQGSYIFLSYLFRRPLHWDSVDQASVIYSNCGNLIIPIVSYILGPEWIIYCTGFMVVQNFLIWTHGRLLITGEKITSLKSIFLNPGCISIAIGFLLFLIPVQMPALLLNLSQSLSNLLAPLAMLIIGFILAKCDLKEIFLTPRFWQISLFRLILLPLFSLVVLQCLKWIVPLQQADSILMITLLACAAPCANMIVQFAQLSGKNEEKASMLNVITTLLALFTMPIMLMLYQML